MDQSPVDYNSKTIPELRALFKRRNMTGYSGLKKSDLIQSIFKKN
jgi:hypothetical protein